MNSENSFCLINAKATPQQDKQEKNSYSPKQELSVEKFLLVAEAKENLSDLFCQIPKFSSGEINDVFIGMVGTHQKLQDYAKHLHMNRVLQSIIRAEAADVRLAENAAQIFFIDQTLESFRDLIHHKISTFVVQAVLYLVGRFQSEMDSKYVNYIIRLFTSDIHNLCGGSSGFPKTYRHYNNAINCYPVLFEAFEPNLLLPLVKPFSIELPTFMNRNYAQKVVNSYLTLNFKNSGWPDKHFGHLFDYAIQLPLVYAVSVQSYSLFRAVALHCTDDAFSELLARYTDLDTLPALIESPKGVDVFCCLLTRVDPPNAQTIFDLLSQIVSPNPSPNWTKVQKATLERTSILQRWPEAFWKKSAVNKSDDKQRSPDCGSNYYSDEFSQNEERSRRAAEATRHLREILWTLQNRN
eukprot:GHVP01068719.1.p1 GENE.GHVP01068719.1~~GHVP01068719.1.p1  ORF type:complete len:410 (+),score=61.27 GHVP01068719.1:90-1319(+)